VALSDRHDDGCGVGIRGKNPSALLRAECDLCGSGACPRFGRRGLPDISRLRSSRASALLQVECDLCGSGACPRLGDAVYQAHRVIVHREQARSYRRAPKPVGAVLARDLGDAVYQSYRVIVHREQARSYRRAPKPVGAVLARDWGDAVYQAYRFIAHREQALRWTSGSGIMPLHFESGR